MADENYIPTTKLSPKQKTDLEDAKKTIRDARHELSILKKLGMNVKQIEDKLDWADEVQSTLLKEFGE